MLPTGAGKTTLSELKIAAIVSSGKKVVFLVPHWRLLISFEMTLRRAFLRILEGSSSPLMAI